MAAGDPASAARAVTNTNSGHSVSVSPTCTCSPTLNCRDGPSGISCAIRAVTHRTSQSMYSTTATLLPCRSAIPCGTVPTNHPWPGVLRRWTLVLRDA